MEYPKSIMRKTELMALGFPEKMLLRASREKNQTFAFKENPLSKSSPLLFDTAGLDKWLQKQAKLTTM